jgi:acyl dehydratase
MSEDDVKDDVKDDETGGVVGLGVPVGTHLGFSDWLTVTQERVDGFARVTGDEQWIHVDPQRAATGPFGGTVAHGYLVLSLAPCLLREVMDRFDLRPRARTSVNHGCDRVRFLSPVRVGARLRLGAVLDTVDPIRGGRQLVFGLTFQVAGSRVPACVARSTVRDYW